MVMGLSMILRMMAYYSLHRNVLVAALLGHGAIDGLKARNSNMRNVCPSYLYTYSNPMTCPIPSLAFNLSTASLKPSASHALASTAYFNHLISS